MDAHADRNEKKQPITLGDKMNGKSYVIDLLRFIAAALVIFNHSYLVTNGGDDPIYAATDKGITFGELSVAFFLFVSGLYVTKSLIRKGDGKAYIIGRIKRIYPLFAVVVLLTAFVLGPAMTSLSLGEYFSSSTTYLYLSYLIMIPRYSLPGVFEQNPMFNVNSSLWTLVLETICYVMLLVAYKCGMLAKKKLRYWTILSGICIIAIFVIKVPIIYQYSAYLRPLFCFVSGICFYVFREEIRYTWRWIAVAVLGLACCVLANCYSLATIVFLPYLLCAVMDKKPVWLQKMAVIGRYSYAMYLIGFPIQQVVYATGLGTTVLANTCYSLLFDIVGAVILYHTIEKRF